MPAPIADDVFTYFTDSNVYTVDQVEGALDAEKAAQAARCRVPADDAVWPADLVEALLRRAVTNLANRALPLGVDSGLSEVGGYTVRVGGLDREVRRLEAPYRRTAVG